MAFHPPIESLFFQASKSCNARHVLPGETLTVAEIIISAIENYLRISPEREYL